MKDPILILKCKRFCLIGLWSEVPNQAEAYK